MSRGKNKKVRHQEEDVKITRKPEDTYPVFCFKYLQKHSYHKCTNAGFFIEFIERMQKLANLGWKGINNDKRHGFGTEKIPIKSIKPAAFPSIVTQDVTELTVLRATGNNLPFIGIRNGDIFQVIFIESGFNDIYDHGSK